MTILRRMKIVQLLLSRTVIGILITIAALIGFNASRMDLTTELLADFSSWHTKTALLLDNPETETQALPKLSIKIAVDSVQPGGSRREWTFPSTSLANPTERSQTSRVLQLIRESKVFGLPQLSSNDTSRPSLSIVVTDDKEEFQTIVPLSEIENNIQLQNLLKLLEVFSATPNADVNPAQT